LAQHDCARAREHLEHVVSVWPWRDSARRHFELARCSWRENDPEAASRHLHEAARLGWPTRDVDREGLLIEAQQGLTPDMFVTLADLVKTVQAGDDRAQAALVLEAVVLAHLRARRLPEAAEFATILAKEEPDFWRAQLLLARSLEMYDQGAAADRYRRSLELKADQPQVHRWLGCYLASTDFSREALEHLRAAGPLDPGDVAANLAAAQAHHRLGELREARAALNRVLNRASPPQPQALALAGLLDLDEFGVSEAEARLAKAEALAPRHPDIIDALGVLARRQGNAEKIRHYDQLKKNYQRLAKEEAPTLRKKIDQLYRQLRPDPAELQSAAFRLGAVYFEVGQDELGQKWMESVLADNPGHFEAHQALAAYYERIGEQVKADTHRRRAAAKVEKP
jgi:Tfp pilus assembly protein PilF